jgi:hypothetical protein
MGHAAGARSRKERTVGFLDKAKQLAQQAETQLNQATSQMGGAQGAKVADAWLKELGQWVYADRMGRDPRAAAEVEVRIQQLQQWEQQNGTQVPMPFASPGTTPGGTASQPGPGAPPGPAAPIPGTMADAPPASIPGTLSDASASPIPGTLSDAPASSIPGTLSSPPGAPDPATVPTPGGSLGPLDQPATGPLTVPPAPAPAAPPSPSSPPAPAADDQAPPPPPPPAPPAPPAPPGPPADLPSPPS